MGEGKQGEGKEERKGGQASVEKGEGEIRNMVKRKGEAHTERGGWGKSPTERGKGEGEREIRERRD